MGAHTLIAFAVEHMLVNEALELHFLVRLTICLLTLSVPILQRDYLVEAVDVFLEFI
jgi:hypothetical protein